MRLTIERYHFDLVCFIRPDEDADGIRAYLPQARFTGRDRALLHAYGSGPFCRFRIPASYPFEGVYALTADNQVRYVGECEHLTKRYNRGYGNISPRNCYVGGQSTNCRINNLIWIAVQQGQQIDLLFFQTADRKQVEAELIRAVQPQWNTRGLGTRRV